LKNEIDTQPIEGKKADDEHDKENKEDKRERQEAIQERRVSEQCTSGIEYIINSVWKWMATQMN
jgi:hypothetical protein